MSAHGKTAGRRTKERILIVDDSMTSAFALRKAIEDRLHFETIVAATYRQTKSLIEEKQMQFSLAIIDLVLPDDSKGKVVDYICSKGIPVMVFTGSYKEKVRELMLSKNVIDYFVKENPDIINTIVDGVHRIARNRHTKVLVVEDSATSRLFIREVLERYLFRVFDAADGGSALKILKKHPDIRVIITDYHMPKIDGFQLTAIVRKTHERNKLAIIGLSADEKEALSIRFLKNGANDFLKKPFLPEELYCRVVQNVELIEQFQELREASNTDFLTGLRNRRFFYLVAEEFHKNALRGHLSYAMAIIDIDDFKRINDTCGHDAGDVVLKKTAALLRKNTRKSDILCRFGGEEFCVLMTNVEKGLLPDILEKIRTLIENTTITARNRRVRLTVSIGATVKLESSLDLMILAADRMLYEAKHQGKNRVVIDFGV